MVSEAAAIINRVGLANTRVSDVMRKVGATRTAFYYYFNDIEDLAYACFTASLDHAMAVVAEAEAVGDSSLAKVDLLLERLTTPAFLRRAVLIDVRFIGGEREREIRERRSDCMRRIARLLDGGAEPGTAKRARLRALLFTGALSYLATRGAPTEERELARIRAGFRAVFIEGLARSGHAPLDRSLSAAPAAEAFVASLDREAMGAIKRDALVRTATALFNAQGVRGAALSDVVEKLNVTKGAFYHYIESKEDLLMQCYQRSMALIERAILACETKGETGAQKLDLFIRACVDIHAGPLGPLAAFNLARDLKPALRNQLERRGRATFKRLQAWLNDGMLDGSIGLCQLETAAQAIDGALRWMPRWLDPASEDRAAAEGRAPEMIADALLLGISGRMAA